MSNIKMVLIVDLMIKCVVVRNTQTLITPFHHFFYFLCNQLLTNVAISVIQAIKIRRPW